MTKTVIVKRTNALHLIRLHADSNGFGERIRSTWRDVACAEVNNVTSARRIPNKLEASATCEAVVMSKSVQVSIKDQRCRSLVPLSWEN
jgi:hypothetical protein